VSEGNAGLLEVVVEIPAGTRNKYELDPATNRLLLKRQLPASVAYPADYGFVPGTLAEDGDPLDALILIDEPVVPGGVVRVRLLGLLRLSDEHGQDPKLITILPETAQAEQWDDIADVPRRRLDEIEHFFSVYKDLEKGFAETHGYGDRAEAFEAVCAAQARHRHARPSGDH